MNKKIISLGLVSCFAVISLASCSGKKGYTIPEVNVLTFDEVKEAKEIKISFWHSFGETPTKALEKQVENFMKKYPNIKVEPVSKGGYDNLKKAVTLDIPTGNTPDVVLGYPDHIAEYIAGSIVVPLDEYMKSTDPEVGIGAGSNNAVDDFFENYMTENRQYVGDMTFGLPFNKSTELAYYNKTLFQELDLKVPETWEDVPVVAKKLQDGVNKMIAESKDNIYECKKEVNKGKKLNFSQAVQGDIRPITYDSEANAFITLLRDYNAPYTELGENFEEGYIAFDNDTALEVMGRVEQWGKDKLFGVPGNWEGKNYCSDIFKNVASYYTIGSSAGSYHNIPDGDTFEVGVAPIPYAKDGSKNVIQQGTNIAMLANNSDLERMASWLLIRYLTAYNDEENQEQPNVEFSLEASYLPVTKSGYNSALYKEFLAASIETGATTKDIIKAESAKMAAAYGDDWNKFTDPAFIGSSEVRTKVEEIIPSIIVAGLTPKAAIQKAYNQLPGYQK